MSDFNRGYPRTATAPADMAVDAGLRAFMLGVYNKMALGLVLSAVMAYATSHVAPVRDLLFRVTDDGHLIGMTILGQVVAFSPLAVIFGGQFLVRRNPGLSGVIYWLTVSLIGASLGAYALIYRLDSIFTSFLITATAFGGLSLFGYTTKRDLSGWGSFLYMGLIGIIVASIVGLFLHSPALVFALNVLIVLLFAGFMAYDTQKLKMTYYQLGGDKTAMGVATDFGALNLYLDFLNMFLALLRLFGGRR